jgi:hypothetical protein
MVDVIVDSPAGMINALRERLFRFGKKAMASTLTSIGKVTVPNEIVTGNDWLATTSASGVVIEPCKVTKSRFVSTGLPVNNSPLLQEVITVANKANPKRYKADVKLIFFIFKNN